MFWQFLHTFPASQGEVRVRPVSTRRLGWIYLNLEIATLIGCEACHGQLVDTQLNDPSSNLAGRISI